MTRRERILAASRKQPADRLPFEETDRPISPIGGLSPGRACKMSGTHQLGAIGIDCRKACAVQTTSLPGERTRLEASMNAVALPSQPPRGRWKQAGQSHAR